MNIPKHVAIILDGNGRWAKKKHMPRNYGHVQGAKTVEQICEDADSLGIKYLTVYAFSTENWNRPENEVNALMTLLRNYLKDCIKRSNKNNMRVRVIGEKSRLNDDIRNKIDELENAPLGDGGYIIYINGQYRNVDTPIGKLIRVEQAAYGPVRVSPPFQPFVISRLQAGAGDAVFQHRHSLQT